MSLGPMLLRGLIAHRVLLNWHCEPQRVAPVLPDGLRVRTVRGRAIVGVCLIELESVRPAGLPSWAGLRSRNAAYRVSVEGGRPPRHGVWVPVRDTDSNLVSWFGGVVFPGRYRRARFETAWGDGETRVSVTGADGAADLILRGRPTDAFPRDSVFGDLESASSFFRDAEVGWSPGRSGPEAVRLHIPEWIVRGFEVDEVRAGAIDRTFSLPAGSSTFDSALYMTGVAHTWLPLGATTLQSPATKRSPAYAPTPEARNP